MIESHSDPWSPRLLKIRTFLETLVKDDTDTFSDQIIESVMEVLLWLDYKVIELIPEDTPEDAVVPHNSGTISLDFESESVDAGLEISPTEISYFISPSNSKSIHRRFSNTESYVKKFSRDLLFHVRRDTS